MNLSNESIQSTVGNLLTIGSAAGTPTTGTLQNGVGQDVTSLVLDELQVNRLVQTQATIAANGTTLSGATLLSAGVNLVTSADSSNIAVKLPDSQLGLIVNVVNTSSRDIQVFPFAATHSLVGLSAGAAFTVPADNQLYQFVCVQNPVVGVWSVTTPIGNSVVKKSVSVNLVADGTHSIGDTSYSSSALLGANITFYPTQAGGYHILDAPAAGVDYFDTPEFNTYNKVKATKLTLKTNIPAGNLSNNVNQYATTLMGLAANQFSFTWDLRLVQQYPSDTASLITFQSFAPYFYNDYSIYANAGASTGAIGHYAGAGGLFQKVELTNFTNWMDTKSANGDRAFYFSPHIQYGNSVSAYSAYPSGFSFEAEMIVDFEFSM